MCHTNQFLFCKENGTLTLSICIVLKFYALRENFVCVCVCVNFPWTHFTLIVCHTGPIRSSISGSIIYTLFQTAKNKP